jgi:hypothetical protein
MKAKVYKTRHGWMWLCRMAACYRMGRNAHWEIAHLDAREHMTAHKRPVPHDNDMTPPGGMRRYGD